LESKCEFAQAVGRIDRRQRSLIRTATILLLFAYPTGLSVTPLAGDEEPDEIIRSAVKIIEDHYLFARSNTFWNAAKERLLKGGYKDQEGACRGLSRELATLGDSELNVVSKAQLAELQKETAGQRMGIGLIDFSIDHDPSGEARIVAPIFGTPSAELAARPGDIIEAVNGKPTKGMTHEEVLGELRRARPNGTELKLRRGDVLLGLIVHSTQVKLDAVHAESVTRRGKKIGYIRVAQFTPEAGQQMRLAVSRLESESVDAYILDLRNNPGGLINSAVAAASAFASGTLGFTVHVDGNPEPIESTERELTKTPVIILINRGTASAAEVLTAALQDIRRGTIIGMPSYGRAQAQRYYPLTEGCGMTVPSAVIRTRSGKEFGGRGLMPDIAVPQDSVSSHTVATEQDALFARAVATLAQKTTSDFDR